MTSLSDDKQADIIEAFNSTSRYLDDLLNIGNPYFEGMVNQIYPPELQLNKANTSDTEAPFFGFTSIYFPFLDDDVPRRPSYGVYISQLIRFASVCSHVEDFNARNKCSDQFRKIIIRHKRIGYDLNVIRQSACLVINTFTVDNFAALFNCTPVGRVSDSMMAPT